MAQRKVAIVTGAGSGIGRATVVALAQAGYSQVLVGRRRDALEETAQWASEDAAADVELAVLPTDLRDADASRQVVEAAAESFGRIDALANVAGWAQLVPIDQITPELWRTCIDTNLSAVVHLTAAAWPVFKRQRGGLVVNVSSLSSVDPFPRLSIYAAAKAGLNMFTHCTAQEGAAIGVTAVALVLGCVETPMLRGMFDAKAIPPERTLPPQRVAEVIRDCITGRQKFESGQTLLVPSP